MWAYKSTFGVKAHTNQPNLLNTSTTERKKVHLKIPQGVRFFFSSPSPSANIDRAKWCVHEFAIVDIS